MGMETITHIVVHYSATARGNDIGAAEIDRMHKARGWKGIGYHYVIRLDGTVEKGRPDTQVGAHVGGQNSGKLGICWIGGTEPGAPSKGVDTRTPQQTAALIDLIRNLKAKHPGALVVGHRDLAATQCPGFDVIPWWEAVELGHAVSRPPPPPADAPVCTPDVIEGDAYTVRRGDTLWAIARAHDVSVETIAAANGIAKSSILMPGQLLRIPTGEADGPRAAMSRAPQPRHNYRGRFGPGDGGFIKRPSLKGQIMKDQTIHKAIAAFLTSLIALLVAFGVPVPTWFSGDVISWIAAIIAALVGSGITGLLTWWIPNRPQ